MASILLRGARALLGDAFSLSASLDIAIERALVGAIAPAGSLPVAAPTIMLEQPLVVPGMMMLGSGVAPVRELLRAGVNVGMGTDGTCSTVTASMLTSVGSAAALGKVRGEACADWLSAHEALSMATRGGARAIGFGDGLGTIAVGARADLCSWRLDSIAFTPLADPVRQLVYGERGAGLDTVLVAGEPVIEGGRFTRIDEAALSVEIGAAAERLAPESALAEASVEGIHRVMERVLARCAGQPVAADTWPARL